MKEKCKVMVLEDRMLKVTFGSQREKVAGNLRKLHHKKLRDFEYYSSDQIKDNEMIGACGTYREEERWM